MTALKIILSILAVIAFLLFLNVNIYIDYRDDKLAVWLRYFFIKINLYPTKEKKKPEKSKKKTDKKADKAKQKKTDTDEKKEGVFSSISKEDGLSGVIEVLSQILDLIKSFSSSTLNHLRIKKLSLNIVAGGEDAAQTALNFGYVCSTVYPLLGALSGLITFLKTPDINITTDYDKKETTAQLLLCFRMRLGLVIGIVLKYGIKGILLYIGLSKADNNKENQKVKS